MTRQNHKISRLIRGYFRNAATRLAIATKLHCPKGDRINESLLQYRIYNYKVYFEGTNFHGKTARRFSSI